MKIKVRVAGFRCGFAYTFTFRNPDNPRLLREAADEYEKYATFDFPEGREQVWEIPLRSEYDREGDAVARHIRQAFGIRYLAVDRIKYMLLAIDKGENK